MRTTTLLPILATLLTLGTTGCPGGDENAPTRGEALEQIQKRKTFDVVTDATYPPFETKNSDDELEGFDIDLVKAIAKELDVEPNIRNTAWDGVFNELSTGRTDAVVSGVSITEKRQKTMAFTRPYAVVGQAILKRKGDERIKSYKDLNSGSLQVATQLGTTGEEACKKHLPKAYAEEKITAYKKIDEACRALVDGKADAVVFDLPYLLKYIEKQPEGLVGLWDTFTREPIGIAVRKDSPKLVEKLNEILAKLEDEGTLEELRKKWFGEAADKVKPTADDLK